MGVPTIDFGSLGKSESAPATEQDYLAFCKWLKCYENPDMNTARDHNRRTIWFKVSGQKKLCMIILYTFYYREKLVQCALKVSV